MAKVSEKYRRRIRAVRGQTQKLRRESKAVLVEGLREVHDDQLTNVTNLPITGRMRRSIGGRIKGQSVEVGYNIGNGPKALYAGPRLNMKGRSKKGGHNLEMHPAPALEKKTRGQLKRLSRDAQRGIIGD
jgi:hypothetical protein